MLEEAKNFVRNQKLTRRGIWENISINGKRLPQRFIFVKLRKYVRDFLENKTIEPRMVGIAGIRGVGKTTLLWQIADFVKVKKNFGGIDVYFLSMDIASNYGFETKHMIEALKDIISPSKKVVLLFDETQYIENWSLMLKIIYDKFKNAFIIATGSSSLLIHSTVDLSTRWSVESLYPLSFTEFIMIKSWLKNEGTIFPTKGLGGKIKEALFYSKNADEVKAKIGEIESEIKDYFIKVEKFAELERRKNYLNEYIFYHNIPRLLMIDEKSTILIRTFDLLHRVLYQDLREFYQQNEVGKIRKFLIFLAFSDELNKEKTSQNLGIGVQKIDKIIDSLVKAEILIKFPSYGGTKTRIKREKLFFISPTIRYAIIRQLFHRSERFHPKLYEDITALYLKKIFNGLVLYGGMGDLKSPDFIIEMDSKIIPVEVGTDKKDLSQLNTVENKKYGLLLNFTANEVQIIGNNVVFPLKWFLLI